MAQIIRVDFTARTVVEVRAEEPTDEVSEAIAELVRAADAELASKRGRAPRKRHAEPCCPVCHSTTCRVWRAVEAAKADE